MPLVLDEERIGQPTQYSLAGHALRSIGHNDRANCLRRLRRNGWMAQPCNCRVAKLWIGLIAHCSYTCLVRISPQGKWEAAMTDRWRLVHGVQLLGRYSDRGQRRDVACDHSAVVVELRGRYETWSPTLEPAFKCAEYIGVGLGVENPCRFPGTDWYVYRVGESLRDQTRAPPIAWVNGWWMVKVACAGRHRDTLCHSRIQPSGRLTQRAHDCDGHPSCGARCIHLRRRWPSNSTCGLAAIGFRLGWMTRPPPRGEERSTWNVNGWTTADDSGRGCPRSEGMKR